MENETLEIHLKKIKHLFIENMRNNKFMQTNVKKMNTALGKDVLKKAAT